MSGFPWSIKQKKEDNFEFMIIQKLSSWKRAMRNCIGDSTLGQSYSNLHQNMFGVGYIEKMRKTQGKDTALDKVFHFHLF